MKTYEIYIGGKFKKTDYPLTVTNPYNNKPVAETFLAKKEELEQAIAAAQAVQNEMKALPSFQKYEILMQISTAIKNNREHLADVLAQEAAKPLRYALGEIDRATQTFLVAAEESKRLPSDYISIDWTPAGKGKEGLVKYFPIGLIAGISPFNFPMNLAVHKIAPAIAAGNPIILKPARATPLSVCELAKIIDQTSLPKGAVSILPMDRESGNQLVTDERFNMVTFTGSPEVGWKMKREAGKKKVVLELGGNAGAAVTESADLDCAVQRCLIGGFAYSGQVCIHLQRISIHKSIFSDFKDAFVNGAKNLKEGPPTDINTDITAMIDEENAVRVEEWIKKAVNEGAELLCGGNRRGSFVEPTILTNTTPDMLVNASEAFGPVVTIEPYTNFKEAIDSINNSIYGLQAGVFTNNLNEVNYAFNNLDVGGVIINDIPTFRVDHMPYGGIKDSGFGREGLKYSIMEMLEPKLMVKNK
jgi:glyceraldehyde-3-phosphate dehydrogenase (NADP+)